MERKVLSDQEFNDLVRDIWPLTKGFDLMPDHVLITDPHGAILYANKAVQHNTGYSPEEILRKNPGDLWGGNMPKEFYEEMWRTISEFKRPFVGKVKNKRKDGTEYWQELRVFPVLDHAGAVKIYIGIEPNINLTKTQEDLKERYYRELEQVHGYLLEKARKMDELEKEVAELRARLGDKDS